VSVTLDVAKSDKPQTVSFVVGENSKVGEFNSFKHGYAGTIYRGQGRTLDEAYVAHSAQWRSSASYVALTRHRESVHIFAARETVKDLEAMAAGMERAENKRAASAYSIDPHSAGLELAMAELTERRPAAITETASRTATVKAKTAEQATPANRTASSARAEARPDALAATASRAVRRLGGAAAGAARMAEGVANIAAGAIESLASLFGGRSPAPAPQQEQQRAAEAEATGTAADPAVGHGRAQAPKRWRNFSP